MPPYGLHLPVGGFRREDESGYHVSPFYEPERTCISMSFDIDLSVPLLTIFGHSVCTIFLDYALGKIYT